MCAFFVKKSVQNCRSEMKKWNHRKHISCPFSFITDSPLKVDILQFFFIYWHLQAHGGRALQAEFLWTFPQ